MDVRIQGRRVSLAGRDTLGDGGEATVLRHGAMAVKVYHAPSTWRAEKLRALLAMAARLPDGVVKPVDVVEDARGKSVVGFTMPALAPGHEPLAVLSNKAHRAAAGLGGRSVTELFLDAHRTLSAIHVAGAVVGDLNDANELFLSDRVAFIDVDSFQIPGYACEVATEPFLDPELYGPDLAAPVLLPKGPRAFSPDADWYAYAVLLFRSLTLVHPYGGVDPSLPTLPRRAKAHRSVFAPGVRYPSKIGYALEVLSDELAGAMRSVFEGGRRGPLPEGLVAAYGASLVRCTACGTDVPSERARCPVCAAAAPAACTSTAADCTAEDLFETAGPVVALRAAGTFLRAIAVEDGRVVLHAHDGRSHVRADLGAASADLHVELGPTLAAVARGEQIALHALAGLGAIPAGTTAAERGLGGRPTFAVSGTRLYRVARGMLLAGAWDGAGLDEKLVTAVMPEQTRVFAGKDPARELVIGACRLFRDRRWFLVSNGARVELDVPDLDPGEAIVEEEVLFSNATAMLARRTRRPGGDRVLTALWDASGHLVARHLVDVIRRGAHGVVAGGALAGASALFATDRGICRERVSAGAVDRHVLDATEPFTSDAAPLEPFAGGLAVAHGQRVRLLRIHR